MIALSCAAPAVARDPKARRIGFFSNGPSQDPKESSASRAFLAGMHDLGYVEGRDFVVDWRFDSGYESYDGIAAAMLRAQPDVLVAGGTPRIRALQKLTSTIPIVMATSIDPVASGFVKSLSHPGGNITGLTRSTTDTSTKYLELLKLMIPSLSRVALLVNSGNSGHASILENVQRAARTLGVEIVAAEAHDPQGLDNAFAAMKRQRMQAVIVSVDGYFRSRRQQIIGLTMEHRLPSLFTDRDDVQAGGLMNYGQVYDDFYHRAAAYVDKIFKGAKPENLPVEQPTQFHLSVNSKTAKALGLTISTELLLRADEVIE